MMNYKKYLTITIILGALIYPEYVFGAIAIILAVLLILFVIVDLVLDIYILVVAFIDSFKGR